MYRFKIIKLQKYICYILLIFGVFIYGNPFLLLKDNEWRRRVRLYKEKIDVLCEEYYERKRRKWYYVAQGGKHEKRFGKKYLSRWDDLVVANVTVAHEILGSIPRSGKVLLGFFR